MSQFEQAIPTVLRHEGGYVFDPADPGGETNFGISRRSYPNIDIKGLTSATASMIYRQDWWDNYGYGRILDQRIATKVFDTAVNMGAMRAHKIAQVAAGTTPDGRLGSESIKALNDAQPSILLHALQDGQAARYRNLVLANPALQKFLNGWIARAYDRV